MKPIIVFFILFFSYIPLAGGNMIDTSDMISKRVEEGIAKHFSQDVKVSLTSLRVYGKVPPIAEVSVLAPKVPLGLVSLEFRWQEQGRIKRARGTVISRVVAHVAVAKVPIQSGQVLGKHNLWMEERDISHLSGMGFFMDWASVSKLSARSPLRPGQVVSNINAEVPYLVTNGQFIQGYYQKGNLRVVARMKALQKGRKGDNIRVLNTSSKKVLHAQVISGGRVVIQ